MKNLLLMLSILIFTASSQANIFEPLASNDEDIFPNKTWRTGYYNTCVVGEEPMIVRRCNPVAIHIYEDICKRRNPACDRWITIRVWGTYEKGLITWVDYAFRQIVGENERNVEMLSSRTMKIDGKVIVGPQKRYRLFLRSVMIADPLPGYCAWGCLCTTGCTCWSIDRCKLSDCKMF
jgi:hypothetical protein